MQYKGVLFDYDGTLTTRYTHDIPRELIERIVFLNQAGVKMGLCTARSFRSAIPSLDVFMSAAENPEIVRKNWVLICENGSKGYLFDEEKQDYREFYSAVWPEHINRDDLYERLVDEFSRNNTIINNDVSFEVFRNGSDEFENDDSPAGDVEKNEISLILRPSDREKMQYTQWEASSRKIYDRVLDILMEFDPQGLLNAGDSKMGVSILVGNSDKDRGIKEFAKLLNVNEGFDISDPYREIIGIGDQANEGGNDYHFLKGEVGTTYTVGEETSESSKAQKVFDVEGNLLQGPMGTLEVLLKSDFGV